MRTEATATSIITTHLRPIADLRVLDSDTESVNAATDSALTRQQHRPLTFARTTLLETLAVAQAGQMPSIDLAARVGVLATSNVSARTALAALACYHGAWQFSAALAVQTRGAARVHLLSLTTLIAYSEANWAGARNALERAQKEAGPEAGPTLLRLLSYALEASVPPEQARALCGSGVRTLASGFGIVLSTPATTAAAS